ncbi:hypothetical protein LTR10_016150 [Elasticomyces elasticus]|uniref:Uncharacterized protein n=1 Tax=Exophiala sideris TaxID=1016849 RepID=A0ABR0JEN2_9EURO|nr:hypothetical protein LTR10_016150 [Elasticomyces elasticus]KAK5027596.1 hypothetical protein LTR13_009529 [Exophiala sideris]KAK5032841.1 hypothetical protein LTS07_004251 [Exophiala sideris]KAK5062365.1 hypothetical protein LTR69_004723 [Exophiala sideris]KAK5177523.1 hypothetical protein LTR44_009933 [Eurotiomycetes sp. CCFEE 6388]
MSDIEDYAYSPYDDIDDLLWDADPAPELADDLAEHACPSPVYQDEIAGFELQEYHSDWEYYSDDYMDDDPALLKNNTLDGGPPKQAVKKKDTGDMSTVWGRPGEQNPPRYNTGQGMKVALMKNWKEVFAITDDGWSKQRHQSDEDESWAKDMSLADMGLQNMQGKALEADAEGQPSEYAVENVEEVEDGDEDEEDVSLIAEDDVEQDDSIGVASKKESEPPPTTTDLLANDTDHENSEELPRKRRRVEVEVPVSQLSRTSLVDSVPSQKRSSAKAKGKLPAVQQIESEPVKTQILNEIKSNGIKKRKAIDEPEEGGFNRPTASSRAKRVASTTSKISQNGTSSTRQTRSSKK